jgi:hypothetical protein
MGVKDLVPSSQKDEGGYTVDKIETKINKEVKDLYL